MCVLLCHEFTAVLLFGLFFWIRTGPIRPYLERGLMGGLNPPRPTTTTPPSPPDSPLSPQPPSNMQLCALHFPKYSCYATKCAKTSQVPARSARMQLSYLLPGGGGGVWRGGGGGGGGRDASSMSCVFVAVLFCFAYE